MTLLSATVLIHKVIQSIRREDHTDCTSYLCTTYSDQFRLSFLLRCATFVFYGRYLCAFEGCEKKLN